MNNKILSLVSYKGKRHANHTELGHLSQALLTKPHKLGTLLHDLFVTSGYTHDTTLLKALSHYGGTMTIPKTEWEWEVKGCKLRPSKVIEAYTYRR